MIIAALLVILLTTQAGPRSLPNPRNADGQATKAFDRVIDINRASPEDFEKLPGIGPELARRIVTFREKHGPFRRVEDLLAIRGIGNKKWKLIRANLRVGEAGGKGRSTKD